MPELEKLVARDVMTSPVHHVSPQLRLVDLEGELASQRVSGAPVVERGKVIGIVSRSDVDRALSRERTRSAAASAYYYETDLPEKGGADPAPDPTASALQSLRTLSVRDVMTRDVISVSGRDSLVRVARLMSERRIHRVLVIEDGRLLGLVSSLDVVAAVADARR